MFHFGVQKKRGDRADYLASVLSPKQYPCYILVFNDNWNDYGLLYMVLSVLYSIKNR